MSHQSYLWIIVRKTYHEESNPAPFAFLPSISESELNRPYGRGGEIPTRVLRVPSAAGLSIFPTPRYTAPLRSLHALCYLLHRDLCQRSAQPTPIRLSCNPVLDELPQLSLRLTQRMQRGKALRHGTFQHTRPKPVVFRSALFRVLTAFHGRPHGRCTACAPSHNQPLRVHRFPLRMMQELCLVSTCYPFARFVGHAFQNWWRRRGLNPRPYGCEPYALPEVKEICP